MGEVLSFFIHASALATLAMPNNAGSARFPRASRAVEKTMKSSAGIRPRERQLLTADDPSPVKVATEALPPSSSITEPTVSSIPSEYSRFVNKSSVHNMPIVTNCELLPQYGMTRSIKDIATRLEATRQALDINAADLCRRTGIKPNQWSQFINPDKKRRITLDAAYKLRDEFGLTLDWIYDADRSGLPERILTRLAKVAAPARAKRSHSA